MKDEVTRVGVARVRICVHGLGPFVLRPVVEDDDFVDTKYRQGARNA